MLVFPHFDFLSGNLWRINLANNGIIKRPDLLEQTNCREGTTSKAGKQTKLNEKEEKRQKPNHKFYNTPFAATNPFPVDR